MQAALSPTQDLTMTAARLQIQREGTDVTLVAFGRAVGHLLEASKQLEKDGISAEARARLPAG